MTEDRIGDVGVRALVLWDVDHTLIDNGGMSKATYALAFRRLTGSDPTYPAETEGRTDPEIMREMLERNGFADVEHISTRVPAALEDALVHHTALLRERGCALLGAEQALKAVGAIAGLAQSVLTGNIQTNARLKLSTFNLDRYLDWSVGGFGSDHVVRSELVRIARRRVAEKYGVELAPSAVVLIGDTLRDMRAATASGARVIGVATGKNTVDELAAAGADEVFTDLSDTYAVVAAVRLLTGIG
ncbi:HAD family hydrolase [Nocardia amamiensis]|uniref:HAD family hydrolase n=1 Tax=Nocardia TaxID=1817 RepID=UPI0033E3D856